MAVKKLNNETKFNILCNEVGKVFDPEEEEYVPPFDMERLLSAEALELYAVCWGQDRGAGEIIAEVDGKTCMGIECCFDEDDCARMVREGLKLNADDPDDVRREWMPAFLEAVQKAAERLSGESWAHGCDFFISESRNHDTGEVSANEIVVFVPYALRDRYLGVLDDMLKYAESAVEFAFVGAAIEK